MNQFCLRVSRYYKLWKAEDNNNIKNPYYGQTTQHWYRRLKIVSKLIVFSHIHTFPWRTWNKGVFLASLFISRIRIPISVSKLGSCPKGCSKALVVSMGAACRLGPCLVPCPGMHCPAGPMSGVQAVPAGALPAHGHSFWTLLCQASQLPWLFWNPCITSWSHLPPLQRMYKRWHVDLLR